MYLLILLVSSLSYFHRLERLGLSLLLLNPARARLLEGPEVMLARPDSSLSKVKRPPSSTHAHPPHTGVLRRNTGTMRRWFGARRILKCKIVGSCPRLRGFLVSLHLSQCEVLTTLYFSSILSQATFLLEILQPSDLSAHSLLCDLSLAVDISFPRLTPEGREDEEERQWQDLLVRHRVPRKMHHPTLSYSPIFCFLDASPCEDRISTTQLLPRIFLGICGAQARLVRHFFVCAGL